MGPDGARKAAALSDRPDEKIERKIRTRVKRQMEKTQREYYLNEQMQAIQKELGDRDEFKNELGELAWAHEEIDSWLRPRAE